MIHTRRYVNKAKYAPKISDCLKPLDVGEKAVDELNKFIAENKHLKASVISYQVVRYEQYRADRTYILVEVE